MSLYRFHLQQFNIKKVDSTKKFFFHLPVGLMLKTKNCGGGHLGFSIHTRYVCFLKDHSRTVWVQSCLIFVITRFYSFSYRIQC